MKEGAPQKNGNITTPEGEEFWENGKLVYRFLGNGTVEEYVAGKLAVRILADGTKETFDRDGNSLGRHDKELEKIPKETGKTVGGDTGGITNTKETLPTTQKEATQGKSNVKLDQFAKNRSGTLLENPKAKLDHYKEILAYLNKLEPEYLERVIELASQRPQMEMDCRVSICIPVAGHQEEDNVYKSLKNYANQTAKKENFEIVLFVNHPEKDQEGDNPLNATETLSEIERFKKDYPELNIRVMYEVLQNKEARMGRIRKLLTDATLVAQHERGEGAPDLIIISNDADNKGIDPRYVQTFIDKFEANPQIDGLLGQLDWDPESYQEFPDLHFGTRLFQYLNIIGRRRSGGMVSSGGNSAFRSSIYAGIGGYIDNLTEGEDVAIGQAIIAARDNDKTRFGFAGAGTRLFTSSRRSIDALYSGLAPVEQWNEGFSAFDNDIRKKVMQVNESIDYDNKETIEQLKELLEHVINRTLDVYEAGEKFGKDHPFYQKALGWMGVKYTLNEKGDVVISDMTPVIENLRKYQIEGKLIRDTRSGKMIARERLSKLRSKKMKEAPRINKDTPPSEPEKQDRENYFEKNKQRESTPEFPMLMDSVPSETLLKDSAATLDPNVEIEMYFKRMNPNYRAKLNLLNEKIGVPMHKDTKVVACIPVAGHQESSFVYQTLKSYSEQKGSLEELEVILFVNSPEKERATGKRSIEQTLLEIERARKEFTQLQVRVVQEFLPEDQVRIGNIRKMVTDLALLRQQSAGIKRDLILLSNDADNQGMSKGYVSAYREYFEQHPEKDGAVGNLQFDPNAFIRFPTLQLKQELSTFLDQVGFENGNVVLFGGNSGMKSSIYAAIGGYPSGLKNGEQYWTGETIRRLRKQKSTLGFVKDSLLVTSSRRGVISLILGTKEQIAFGDQDVEAKMRDLNLDAFPVFDYANKEAIKGLKKDLEEDINAIISAYEKGDELGKDSHYYQSSLRRVGIQYKVDANKVIHITDMSKFVQRQKIMQKMIAEGEKNMSRVIEASEIK